jgi:hypothetical protein
MTPRKFVLLAALLACGCSPASGSRPGSAEVFQPSEDDGKIVVYAVFDDPSDESLFGETFRVHVDSGYLGDIDKGEYVEARVQPGDHVIDVSEIGWGGAEVNKSTLKQHVKPRGLVFVTEHALPDNKATLLKTDTAQGSRDISGRKLLCVGC